MNCPQPQQLQQLLDEALPVDQQQTIQAHLETCELCQKKVEQLAAGGATWDRTAQHLAEPPKPVETALLDAVGKLQETPTSAFETQVGTPPAPFADDLSFLQSSTKPGAIGRLDKYEILSIVGKGGFGIVLKAFDESLHRVVAVKFMAPHLASNGAARQRFEREARAAAAVTHENVVHIYEVRGDVKIPYLAMQFVSGQTLHDKVEKQGALSVKEILRIGMQVAEGLAAAHKQGLIHRDIKPGNILLENGVERVKITDFGLARSVDDASATQSGTVAGTPMFMSPEQANGEPVDHRSDLFSLGSVLYVMCTGRAPFRATSTMAVLRRVCDDTPTPVEQVNADIPDWLSAIIARLLAKKPAERFPTAREVADLLGKHLADLQAGRIGLGNSATTVTLPVAGATMPGPDVPTAPLSPPVAPKAAAKSSSGRGWVLVLLIVFLVGVIPAGLLAFCIVIGGMLWLVPAGGERAQRQDPIDVGARVDVSPAPPTKTKVIKEEIVAPVIDAGWVQLFNGRDLTGWKTTTPVNDTWSVEDGLLVGKNKAHQLMTLREDFENFHLRVEFMVNDGGNSGVYFRSQPSVAHPASASQNGDTYEAQIQESPSADKTGSLGLHSSAAPRKNLSLHMQKNSVCSPNTWSILEVIARGDRLVTIVNGKPCADIIDSTYRKGRIGLQMNRPTTVVQFKRIEIKELPPAPARSYIIAGVPKLRKTIENQSPIKALAFTADSSALIVGGQTLSLFDAVKGDLLQEEKLTSPVAAPLSLSADRKILAVLNKDSVVLWDLPLRKKPLFSALGNTLSGALSPDGKMLVYGTDNKLMIHNRASGETGPEVRHGRLMNLKFSPDGRFLVGTASKELFILDANSRNLVARKNIGIMGLTDISQDSKHVVATGMSAGSPSFFVFRLADQALVYEETHLGKTPASVAFSPDGNYLALGMIDGEAQLWDLIDRKRVAAWSAGKAEAVSPVMVAFAPDGKALASGNGNTISLWDFGAK